MLIAEIDTRQGTNNSPNYSHGNCLPYVGVPFAMNYFAVQTNGAAGSWFFNPYEHRFEGIRLTHQPSPWIGDYNQLLLTAVAGDEITSQNIDYAGTYNGKNAVFSPSYQKIKDERYQTVTKLVPTTYGASFNYTNLLHQSNKIVIRSQFIQEFQYNANQQIFYVAIDRATKNAAQLRMYVALDVRDNLDLQNCGYWDNENQWHPLLDDPSDISSIVLAFSNSDTVLNLATSYLSYNQATLNLNHFKDQSFADLRKAADQKWQTYFDRIKVEDTNTEMVKTFYTCLYRLFLFPQRFYEIDKNNESVHFNMYTQKIEKGLLFTNNGFWDTSKSVYPLFSIIAPEILPKFLTGFLNSYHESGYLPKWLAPDELGMMPGTLIDAVIADAATKGIGLNLMPELLHGMIKSATVISKDKRFGRTAVKDYARFGYVPTDSTNESVNFTLDYAFSDFCIAQVATILNKPDVAKKYLAQSKNYRNLFDKKFGLMIGKNSKGKFSDFFTADTWGYSYTEGSAWQNSFSVYHDIPGLIQLYGGEEDFNQKLVELCNTDPTFKVGSYGQQIHEMTEMASEQLGQLAISNQPSFHIPYLFDYAGHPENTQLVIKQLRNFFNSSPNGFPGDEDNGSMSGWFIFACLGFYPVCPGKSEYALGLPAFDKVVLKLASGKTLKITTQNNVIQNNFVRSRTLNQQPYNNLYITHQQLLKGGTFDSTLSLLPSCRSTSKNELPH